MKTPRIRSAVVPELLHRSLWIGCLRAVLGVIALFYAFSLQIEILERWGWILFLLALSCITWGLLPHRKLVRLSENPNELILLTKDRVLYRVSCSPPLLIPLWMIVRSEFVQEKSCYGISLTVCSEGDGKISQELFLPYFTKRSYETFQEWLSS